MHPDLHTRVYMPFMGPGLVAAAPGAACTAIVRPRVPITRKAIARLEMRDDILMHPVFKH